MNNRRGTITLIIATAVLVSSCTSVKTKSVADKKGAALIQIPYYLPKGLITIDLSYKPKTRKVTRVTESNGDSGPTKVTETYEVTETTNVVRVLTTSVDYIPDEEAGLKFARYSRNALSDDAVTVKAPEGLLQSASSTSEDKTLVVVENLALAGLEAFKLPSMGILSLDGQPDKSMQPDPTTPLELHLTFDPTQTTELNEANTLLGQVDMKIMPAHVSGPECASGSEGAGSTEMQSPSANGLNFRPLRYYHLYKSDKLIASFGVPDCRYTFTVPLARSAFVPFKTTLDIKDGILRGYSVDKKSEVAAVSGLPLRLLKEIVQLPKGILVYQESQVSAEAELIKAQTAQIKAAIELEKIQAERTSGDGTASQ